jgi:hypothetical protein
VWLTSEFWRKIDYLNNMTDIPARTNTHKHTATSTSPILGALEHAPRLWLADGESQYSRALLRLKQRVNTCSEALEYIWKPVPV